VSDLPLAGRRVLVTRAVHQASKLSQGLLTLGAEPVEVPVLEIRPPASFGPLDAALRQLDSYNWLILTSANVVRVLQELSAALGISLSRHASLHVAAVGSATAKAAIDAGIKVNYIPESYVAESLVEGLLGKVAGQRVLLARAAVARDVIPDAMRAAGAQVDVVDAYQNAMPKAAPEQLRQALRQGIDAATFTSSSSANHLAEAVDRACLPWPLPGIPAISIGPITSQTLRELGWEPAAEANPSDIQGLISAVARALPKES
jgi:uroporphyrinogen-III synthase/uroporphyrinogen III methyltransferase/synthase